MPIFNKQNSIHMWLSILVIVLFIVGAVGEIIEIVSFERKQKQNKDQEFIHLFRKCHWTYFFIFVACAADRITMLIEKIS